MAETAVAVAEKPQTVRDLIQGEGFKAAIRDILPKHASPDRFARLAIAAATRVPHLAECTGPTVLRCLMDLSMYGLEPDGRRAHLIPFKKNIKKDGRWVFSHYECQLIIDYKGLVELAFRSGQLAEVPRAEIVCENDEFEYDRGIVTKHKIDFRKPRGEMYAVYSQVRLKGSDEYSYCVLSKAEVDGVRARSKAANDGPWVTDYAEMAKKTAFRRHSKWVPLSSEYHDADAADYDSLAEDVQSLMAEVRRPAKPLFKTLDAAPLEIPADPETDDEPEPQTNDAPSEQLQPFDVEAEARAQLQKEGVLFEGGVDAARQDGGRGRKR